MSDEITTLMDRRLPQPPHYPAVPPPARKRIAELIARRGVCPAAEVDAIDAEAIALLTPFRTDRVYPMPVAPEVAPGIRDYWQAVTDVPCPRCDGGIVRWAEAGNVPGWRRCDGCGQEYQADGSAEEPTLVAKE